MKFIQYFPGAWDLVFGRLEFSRYRDTCYWGFPKTCKGITVNLGHYQIKFFWG